MARYTLAERLDRWRMPFVFATILTLVGAARFDGIRSTEAECVSLALPVFTVLSGAAPFQDASTELRRVVFGVGGLLVACADLAIYSVLFSDSPAVPTSTVRWMLGACGVAAIVLQGVAARRGFRARLAAWFCMGAVFGGYFVAHVTQKDLFASTLAALMVSLFLGGGSGLLLGELSVKLLRGS